MARTAHFDFDNGLLIMDDGDTYEVSALYDDEGEETDDPRDAVTCVAGRDGAWMTIVIRKHFLATVH